MLLIVVEPYYRALEAATRIHDLALGLNVPQIAVVANRVRTDREQEAVTQHCLNHDLELAAVIPYDEAIVEAELCGVAPIDRAPQSPAMEAIGSLATALLARLA
jgi:CO dehydrogenase maturation factor